MLGAADDGVPGPALLGSSSDQTAQHSPKLSGMQAKT